MRRKEAGAKEAMDRTRYDTREYELYMRFPHPSMLLYDYTAIILGIFLRVNSDLWHKLIFLMSVQCRSQL